LHCEGLEVNALLAAIVAVTGIRDDKLAVHEARVDLVAEIAAVVITPDCSHVVSPYAVSLLNEKVG
jgi:hypothetical protein